MTQRTPAEILAVLDQAQAQLDPSQFNLRDILWEIVSDVSGSYELAMEVMGLGWNIIGEVSNTVGDYLANHYWDD